MPIKHHTYEIEDWREEPCETYRATIYVAGDRALCENICRGYCMEIGLCVSVKDCNYIYTGGAESGVEVGLIQYPPFKTSPQLIWEKAKVLALRLAEANHQWSCTVVADNETVFLSRRKRKD